MYNNTDGTKYGTASVAKHCFHGAAPTGLCMQIKNKNGVQSK